MNNLQRVEIGRNLLANYNSLAGECGVDEDTARDAICDILHAAIADGHATASELENICRICIGHVREELSE